MSPFFMIHHLTRATRHFIFWSLIAAAIGMTAIRLSLSGVESYKNKLAVRIGEYLDTPVTIGRLRAKMRGFSPELVLSDIDISSGAADHKAAIVLKEIRIGINLLDVLIRREVLGSSWVTLVGAKLSVNRTPDGSIAIAGLKASDAKPLWLLQGGHYEVLDSDITWHDQLRNGRPLKFESVDIALINDDEVHRINVLMRLPKKYGETLRVSMDLSGNIFEPWNVQGDVYIKGYHIQLPEWVTVDLPFDLDVESGSGDFQAWGEWRQSRLSSMHALVQMTDLKLHRPETGPFPVKRLDSEFRLKLSDNRWQLDVKRFSMETPDASRVGAKSWPDAVFSMAGWRTRSPSPQIALYADNLDLQEASLIGQFIIPSSDHWGRLLRQSQLRGTLKNFSLFADLGEKSAAINGSFADVGMAAGSSFPGLDHLTGHVLGNQAGGQFRLASKDVLVNSGLFRKPLTADRLDGVFSWRQMQDRWIVSSPMVAVDTSSVKSRSRVRMEFAKTNETPFIDLQSSFTLDDASQAAQYLPARIMPAAVVDWLDHAFIKGRAKNGGLLFYGKPDDFPFKNGAGVFEIRFDAEQLELSYDAAWPHLTDVGGEVLFYRDELAVSLNEGTSHGLRIKDAQVSIPSLSRGEQLLINGEVTGSIVHSLDFLRQTPLGSPVDKLLDAVHPSGETGVKLDIKLPLDSGGGVRVDGSARLNQAKLKVVPLDLPVDQVQGVIHFDENGVYSDILNAHALGHPIQIKIGNDGRQTLVNVAGFAAISDLSKQFKLPGWSLASGATGYKIQLRLPHDDGIPELFVESDLQGITLDLPAFLAKTEDQRKRLAMTFNLGEKSLLPVELDYDHKFKAAILFDIARQSVLSGSILVGRGDVPPRKEPGIAFEINSGTLALEDWFKISLGDNTTLGAIDDIKEMKLHADQAYWRHSELGSFELKLKKNGEYWEGKVNSPLAEGEIRLPVDRNEGKEIKLNLDRLELLALKKFGSGGEKTAMVPGADLFPLLSVTSKNTLWNSTPLGALVLETERAPEGMRIKRMELAGSEQTLSMDGSWKMNGEQSLTRIQGRWELEKAGELFSKLGITKDLTETSGAVDFDLKWQAPPYQFSLKDLRGDLAVNFKKGRLLSVEPGFGRILGILAMAQWLKRLQLDFSDVYQEGLTFNSIKGNFVLADGKAITDNLVVDAVPAKIALSGKTDLIRHTVDHIVNVTPKSADALPIAGTIMGKVAAFVAKSLTGAEHEGFFFGSQYRVKGDWADVQISSLHENDGLLQKTWNGITEFPWIRQQDTQ